MAITTDNLEECIFESKRFIARAEECHKNIQDCSNLNNLINIDLSSDQYQWPDTRLSAAVRRSSMDLTRALAKLRKWGDGE